MVGLNLKTIGCGALLSVLAGLLSDHATGQIPVSAIRAWGEYAFDTGGREGQFLKVTASVYDTAVLRSDGRIFVNGDNHWAQARIPVLPPGQFYVDMDAGYGGGAAVTNLGDIVVWGEEWHPSFPKNVIPMCQPAPPLPPGVVYVQVASTVDFALALRSDGELVAWGDNNHGQCNVPTFAPGTGVKKMFARGATSYLILNTGDLVVLGNTSLGQNLVPPLPPGLGYESVYPGYRHFLALRSDGLVVAWGNNSVGQCNVPVPPIGVKYTAVAAGLDCSYAGRSDGRIVSWGTSYGPDPTLDPGVTCVQMASGDYHAVGLLSNGRVITWASQPVGGTLNGFTQGFVPSLQDEQQGGVATVQFAEVSHGGGQNLALLTSGKVIGWGPDRYQKATPPDWFKDYQFQRVAAGWWHSLAMTTAGDVFAWGDNTNWCLNIPPLTPGVTYTDFAGSDQHTVLVRSDGTAVACGNNAWGEVLIPSPPPGVHYVACDADTGKSLLLRSDGQVVSIGTFPPTNQHTIPALPPGLVYTDIAASNNFNTCIRSDGVAVWCGSFTPSNPGWRSIPSLPRGVYYVQADGGYRHVSLRRSDGKVEVCGMVYHQLNAVPPLDPGTSYVQVSSGSLATAARVGPTSTYVGISIGCAGSMPATRLVPRETPRIGKTLEVRFFDLPDNLMVLAFGWQQVTPVPLAFLGMPGCTLDVQLDALVPLAGQNHLAVWSLPIPDDPLLVGVRFYNQALVFDQAAGNGFGAVVSDAAEAVIGQQ